MLEFSGKSEKGKIKVKAKTDAKTSDHDPVKPTIKIGFAAKKAQQSLMDMAEKSKKLAETLEEVNNKNINQKYIFTMIKPNSNPTSNPTLFITRKSDKFNFAIEKKVYSEYSMANDWNELHLIYIKFPAGGIEKHSVKFVVTSEALHTMNKGHIRYMIVDAFARKVSDNFGIEFQDILTILDNILDIPGLPTPEFNGTMFQKHATGGFVKPANPDVLTKHSQNWSLPKSKHVSDLSQDLPGVEQKVECPLHPKQCGKASIWNMIQHLNDGTNWTREQIADWLDSLADDGIINIDFPIPEIQGHEIGDIIVDEIQEFLGEQNEQDK